MAGAVRRQEEEGPILRGDPRAPLIRAFDSHCHIQDPAFDADRDEALRRARAAGVEDLVAIASDPEDAARARALAEAASDAWPRIRHTAGLHPHEAGRWSAAVEAAVAAALDAGAIAVGETGLDHHYDHGPREAQAEAFAAQLALAAARDLPVVVHSRDAEDETLALLADSGLAPARVILHCFTGSAAMLATAARRGYYVSFSGIATFPRFPAADLVPGVPPDRLLVETDAPYLAPVPHRGKRNEPAFVVDTIAGLAAILGEPPEAVAGRTRANARAAYRLAP